jgi:hypothetical protein
MSSLVRLWFLFALIGPLIIPDGRIYAVEPNPTGRTNRPLARFLLAQPGQTKNLA